MRHVALRVQQLVVSKTKTSTHRLGAEYCMLTFELRLRMSGVRRGGRETSQWQLQWTVMVKFFCLFF